MKLERIARIALFLILVSMIAGAQNVEVAPEQDEEFVPVFSVDDYGPDWITGDTDDDGTVDYALKLNDQGEKRFEAMDFNYDGMMDDFYVYRGGVLTTEQLDTNFDGRIDLWIHMHDGVRVRGYQRDVDYDGRVDLVKEFGET